MGLEPNDQRQIDGTPPWAFETSELAKEGVGRKIIQPITSADIARPLTPG
jgi:hypothetical protein